MIVKASSTLVTRRLTHAWRRTHQVVAHPLPSRSSVSDLANDDQLRALYEDLMAPHVNRDLPLRPLDTKRPESAVDTLLAQYAKQGDTHGFERYMSGTISTRPTEHQRDLHVKAHIVNASLSPYSPAFSTTPRFPMSALAVLHHYEASGLFAPIKSYTRVVSALFNVQTSPSSEPGLGRAAAHAQAWDLFAHMRYVAHPVPDAHLFAVMIRACGSFSRPEPERALDLWMEMQDNGVKPTRGAYEAVIKVCGRAGPKWLGEAMRLAREMDERYPITGVNGKKVWCALLEGCKRAGDLQKARWILAEAVRGNGHGAGREASMVDAELMTHVFHTYASYRPPFRRDMTRLVDRSAVSTGEVDTNASQATIHRQTPSRTSLGQADVHRDIPTENVESRSYFSRLPPQTSFGVIAEARALFSRVLDDRYLSLEETHCSHQHDLPRGIFAHVELTPALVNAFLSVFYMHASIEASQEAFDSLVDDSSSTRIFHPDVYTYTDALERCAIARTEDRHVAIRWAKNIWRRWEETEAKCVSNGQASVGSFARSIERAHAAMRRILILSGDVDGALTLLRLFVSRYPPNAVLVPFNSQPDAPSIAMPIVSSPMSTSTTVQRFTKSPILSTRTVLTNPASLPPSTARPLVRLTSVIAPQDDRVPPVLGFSDVDLLHARLAEHGRVKDLGYIKWVCMAYANALKKRRDAVLKATPARHENKVD